MKTKVLLVGGRGYLGRHIQACLINNYEVHITGTSNIDVPYYYFIDYEDSKSYNNIALKFDLIIILASSMSGIGKVNMNNEDFDTNVVYYKNFLQYLSTNKIASKIIYISSMTVYGINNVVPVTEDGKLNPISIYGLSKLLAEYVTQFSCEMSNVKYIILRIPGLFGGDRRSGFIYNTIIKCLNNENILIDTSTLGYWESIDVEYLAFLIRMFIESYTWDISGTYNIGYGKETDIIQTAYKIKSLIKSSSNIEVVGNKGYIPFYLSTEKFAQLVNIETKYFDSLKNYINKVIEC